MHCLESNMMDKILRIGMHTLFIPTKNFVLLETCIEKSKEMLELRLDLSIGHLESCTLRVEFTLLAIEQMKATLCFKVQGRLTDLRVRSFLFDPTQYIFETAQSHFQSRTFMDILIELDYS
jgi:hypothetical protein